MSRNKFLSRNFGKKLAYIRKHRGLSQEELAELLDTAPAYISHIECGKANVPLKKIGVIADALDVDAKELFTFL